MPSHSNNDNTQDSASFGSSMEDQAFIRLAYAEIPARYSFESSIRDEALFNPNSVSTTQRHSFGASHDETGRPSLHRSENSQEASFASTVEQDQHVNTTQASDSDPSVQGNFGAHGKTGPVPISGTGWRPITLKAPLLIFTLCLTLGLAGVVVWCLQKSQTQQGLLFASKISQLPFWRSFAYLYLPTLLSVLYGLYFSWIDLDVKRMEPFFQLSSVAGATPEDSILLDYPFHFLPSVPFKASKRGHWSVVASSMAFLLVSWFLTPFQAGMFAVRTITITEEVHALHATSYTPLRDQEDLSAITAQYVYNIAWFNESLPPYMTKEFVLAASEPKGGDTIPPDVGYNFTGSTLLYGVDVDCERAIVWNETLYPGDLDIINLRHNSTRGCNIRVGTYPPLSKYRDWGFPNGSHLFDAEYRAHGRIQENSTTYALPAICPDTFWIRWSKFTIAPELFNTSKPIEDDSTSLFCNAVYYQQEVDATLIFPGKEVVSINPTGAKRALPADMFNRTAFEYITNEGGASGLYDSSSTYPRLSFPEQQNRLKYMPITVEDVSPMASFAIATYPRSSEAYMDAATLQASYTSAYRLLFARQLAEALSSEVDPGTERAGRREYYLEAVQVVPAFAYIVLGILTLVAGSICWLFFLTLRRASNLSGDPGSISSVMALMKTSPLAIAIFAQQNHSGLQQLDAKLLASTPRFALRSMPLSSTRYTLVVVGTSQNIVGANAASSGSGNAMTRTSRPRVRPIELQLLPGAMFVAFQTLALAALIGLFSFARSHNGLPLPTTSTIARQILENYIPIVTASLIEAFWIVLNRLVCLVQPWEELNGRNARARRSVDLNYNSLPPQLAFVRAWKAVHVKLAIVCFMSILANVLAVSLGGLMFEDSADVAKATVVQALYAPTFKTINATADIPFNSNITGGTSGGPMMDQFYQAMSNITAGTDLPPWVDEQWAYLPVDFLMTEEASTYEVLTYGFNTAYSCTSLDSEVMTYETFSQDVGSLTAHINLTVPMELANGSIKDCSGFADTFAGATKRSLMFEPPPSSGRYALELGVPLYGDMACEQHIVAGWIRAEFVDLAPDDWLLEWDANNSTFDNGTSYEVWPATYYKLRDSGNETLLIDCKPDLLQVEATIEVTGDGRVVRSTPGEPKILDNEAFIKQANHFVSDNGAAWHSNVTAMDFVNYLMAQSSNSNRLIDPSEPVPTFEDASSQLQAMDRRLVAILIAQNLPLLFESAADDVRTTGSTLIPETRIFVSLPAFVVSVAILCPYILTTIWLYATSPGSFLPRLPTTLAAVFAYVAPSNALKYMSVHDAEDDRVERKRWRWGYGSYVGPDGKEHVGVEREQWLLDHVEVIELPTTASEAERGMLAQQ